jgi:hypothetical protein
MAHGIDSLRETNISQHLISSKVSQSQHSKPIDKEDHGRRNPQGRAGDRHRVKNVWPAPLAIGFLMALFGRAQTYPA